MRCADRRGSVLVWVMVTVLILAFISASIARLALGRRILTAKAEDSMRLRLAARAAEHQAFACLQDTGFGRADCSLDSVRACLPAVVAGLAVSFTASGSPPSCRLDIGVRSGH